MCVCVCVAARVQAWFVVFEVIAIFRVSACVFI